MFFYLHHGEGFFNRFLESFPENHIQSFLARISRASQEVGKVVNMYFRNWEISRGGEIFTDANETERLLLLVRSAPDQMVPRLHKLVLNATAEQLRVEHGGGRRHLVVDAGEIAAFQQWFIYAEEILFTLALHESEPGLGNNATEVWSGLFPIVSYVSTPFEERLKIIQQRLLKLDTAIRMLCVEALKSTVDQQRIHMIGGETYGNRIAKQSVGAQEPGRVLRVPQSLPRSAQRVDLGQRRSGKREGYASVG